MKTSKTFGWPDIQGGDRENRDSGEKTMMGQVWSCSVCSAGGHPGGIIRYETVKGSGALGWK